jgi:hypothetical protein
MPVEVDRRVVGVGRLAGSRVVGLRRDHVHERVPGVTLNVAEESGSLPFTLPY